MLRVQVPFLTPYGDVAELADAPDLGSGAARRVGSSLTIPTIGTLTATLHMESTFN